MLHYTTLKFNYMYNEYELVKFIDVVNLIDCFEFYDSFIIRKTF